MDLVEKEQSKLTSTGLMISGAVWVKKLPSCDINYHFESLKQY